MNLESRLEAVRCALLRCGRVENYSISLEQHKVFVSVSGFSTNDHVERLILEINRILGSELLGVERTGSVMTTIRVTLTFSSVVRCSYCGAKSEGSRCGGCGALL